ncbi:hypothetical protein [uncultured Litoreibacter sp.]|uniref:hypothetical protein n=1 Tax=uncultured Litoreibacter sp. TaxID=1392394 RepID=UPI002633EBBE|nr:hypothetical protein [uncultured Litoreibacter sp.]
MTRPTPIETLILISPIVWGLAFVGAVKLGQELFLAGMADPLVAVLMEIFTFFVGMLLALGQFGMVVRYLVRKRWLIALASLAIPPAWFALMAWGISMGAAIVYST